MNPLNNYPFINTNIIYLNLIYKISSLGVREICEIGEVGVLTFNSVICIVSTLGNIF